MCAPPPAAGEIPAAFFCARAEMRAAATSLVTSMVDWTYNRGKEVRPC
jgi:hypothetical protein